MRISVELARTARIQSVLGYAADNEVQEGFRHMVGTGDDAVKLCNIRGSKRSEILARGMC